MFKKTATDNILRLILSGVIDKQALLYCVKYCCNLSLCKTWQEVFYVFCA